MGIGLTFEEDIKIQNRAIGENLRKLNVEESQIKARNEIIDRYTDLITWICDSYEAILRINFVEAVDRGRRLGRMEYPAFTEDIREGLFENMAEAVSTFETVMRLTVQCKMGDITATDVLSNDELRHSLYRQLAESRAR